jgi:hypothetical protein
MLSGQKAKRHVSKRLYGRAFSRSPTHFAASLECLSNLPSPIFIRSQVFPLGKKFSSGQINPANFSPVSEGGSIKTLQTRGFPAWH